MALTNSSRLADFGSGIGTAGAIIQVDNANQRVGIGTINPVHKLHAVYNNNDIAGTYSICNELDIEYEPDDSDNQLISGKINGLKSRISFMESTLTWVWYHSTDDKEKEQMILGYIKNQLDN